MTQELVSVFFVQICMSRSIVCRVVKKQDCELKIKIIKKTICSLFQDPVNSPRAGRANGFKRARACPYKSTPQFWATKLA